MGTRLASSRSAGVTTSSSVTVCSEAARAAAVIRWAGSTARGAMSHRASATRTTVATTAVRFQAENVVSVMGTVRPSCSSMKEPGVAAVSGPDPE